MEYTREYWQPRIATNPNRFRKLNESNDYVELINEPEAITQAGTAFTADRLNNMESGITGAVAGVNEIQGVVDFTTAVNTFSGLSQAPRNWQGMTTLGTDVYACVAYDGDIYKQTGGTGDFIALGQTIRNWSGMTTLGPDVYACVDNGDIYKQTNGTGDFIALGQTIRNWFGMTTLGSDVYACVAYGGDIYKQTNGTGDFIALGQAPRLWYGMTTLGSDVYACVAGGDIYKQTNGAGDFIALGQTQRQWSGMTTLGPDVYACVYNGDIYKQTNGTGDFIALGQAPRLWYGMTTLGSDVYACVDNGDIYTATILTGNTFRASSSFTLPAMPDGARKRILNTHETTAITVTAYSGTTIEGQATMTLSSGHEVELELIGTDWRKTGWNEKSLASFVNNERPYSDTNPVMNGTASQGSSVRVSRQDHVHPLQTSVSGNASTATLATQALAIKPLGNARTLPASSTSVTKIIKIGTVDFRYGGSINITCDGDSISDVVKVHSGGMPSNQSGIRVVYSKNGVYGIKKIIVTYDTLSWNSNRQIYAEIVNYPNNAPTTTLGVVETNRGTFTPSMTEVSSVEGTVVDSLSLDYNRGDISSYQHVFTKNIIGTVDKIPFATKTGTSTGSQGQASFDASYLYLCTATNVWKRVALTSF